ncbi:DUF1833 family protein [Aliihoeflea sp. PC F10.4]
MSIWDAAIAEARASAAMDQIELEAIELLHPMFVSDQNLPDSIRLVLDERAWDLQLEPDAPLKGGQVTAFEPAAMRIVRPDQAEGQIGEVRLAFDFVGREVLPWIDEALSIRADGRLILRSWLANHNADTGAWSVHGGPLEVLRGLTVREIYATASTIELTAAFKDLINVGFPRRRFIQDDFPGLF